MKYTENVYIYKCIKYLHSRTFLKSKGFRVQRYVIEKANKKLVGKLIFNNNSDEIV